MCRIIRQRRIRRGISAAPRPINTTHKADNFRSRSLHAFAFLCFACMRVYVAFVVALPRLVLRFVAIFFELCERARGRMGPRGTSACTARAVITSAFIRCQTGDLARKVEYAALQICRDGRKKRRPFSRYSEELYTAVYQHPLLDTRKGFVTCTLVVDYVHVST